MYHFDSNNRVLFFEYINLTREGEMDIDGETERSVGDTNRGGG